MKDFINDMVTIMKLFVVAVLIIIVLPLAALVGVLSMVGNLLCDYGLELAESIESNTKETTEV